MQKYIGTAIKKDVNNPAPAGETPAVGVDVYVKINSSGALATIYSDNGVTTITQPLVTDPNGRFEFYAANDRYNIEYSLPSGIIIDEDVMLEDNLDRRSTSQSYVISAGSLFAKENSDLEGGEIRLEIADNSQIDGPVVIDSFSERVRFREGSGGVRGAFINLEDCASGALSLIYHSGVKLQASELDSYTVGTLPSAAANTTRSVYVSNLSGGAAPCFSDGANWLRYSDNTIAS